MRPVAHLLQVMIIKIKKKKNKKNKQGQTSFLDLGDRFQFKKRAQLYLIIYHT